MFCSGFANASPASSAVSLVGGKRCSDPTIWFSDAETAKFKHVLSKMQNFSMYICICIYVYVYVYVYVLEQQCFDPTIWVSDAETAKVIQEFEMMKMQNFSMNEFGKTAKLFGLRIWMLV